MNIVKKIAIVLVGSLTALAGIGWLGFQILPRAVRPPTGEPQDLGTISIPSDLPAPVRRYLETISDGPLPRVTSLVAWGNARANFGIWMPLRFHLYHRTGLDFRRDMEVTWFGLPMLKALDQYLNGQGMTGPVGNLETGPRVDQGANLILWAEASLMPSMLITDPRIRWEAIDDNTARLVFPLGAGRDEMLFHFDPQTGLITRTSTLRYQGATGEKVGWSAETLSWQSINGTMIPLQVAVTWENQKGPWSYWNFEGIVWNVDISQTLPTAAAMQKDEQQGNGNH